MSGADGDCPSYNELPVKKSYCEISDIIIPLLLAISINLWASATSSTFNGLDGAFEGGYFLEALASFGKTINYVLCQRVF